MNQTNTNNINKTRVLLQTTRGKDESNIVLCKKLEARLIRTKSPNSDFYKRFLIDH